MAPSQAMEDYLKAIFRLESDSGAATTSAVASRLGVTGPSASGMIGRLENAGLVHREADHGVTLTDEGRLVALRVVRRHRLIETFLHQVVGVPWHAVHDEAEVPVIQGWVNGGNLPADVELISISTAIDPGRPNYPPEEWLASEGWTAPVITDQSGAVADAFGLSAFPYFVFVNADGTVAGRLTGELAPSDLETIIAGLER